jgi:hypothetical protein
MSATELRWAYGDGPPQHTYREAVTRLREFEGDRCLWRLVIGGAALLLLPALAVAGLVVGIYLAADLHSLFLVTLGAFIALGVPILASYVWRQEPWKRLVTERVATYERTDGPQDLNAVIDPDDFLAASRALRQAKLNPVGGTHMPTAPPDAPGLTLKLIVGRSHHWHPEGSPDLLDQIKDALRATGLRARVGGVDINIP